MPAPHNQTIGEYAVKKLALAATASAAMLLLAACGSATDASEDAMADTVEMPADDAMAGAPEPVADDAAMEETEMDAMEAAETAEDMVNDDVEDAIGDAEASME